MPDDAVRGRSVLTMKGCTFAMTFSQCSNEVLDARIRPLAKLSSRVADKSVRKVSQQLSRAELKRRLKGDCLVGAERSSRRERERRRRRRTVGFQLQSSVRG